MVVQHSKESRGKGGSYRMLPYDDDDEPMAGKVVMSCELGSSSSSSIVPGNSGGGGGGGGWDAYPSHHHDIYSYKPKHPRMADVERRISTFPKDLVLPRKSRHFAEDGFYLSDDQAMILTCFFCSHPVDLLWDPFFEDGHEKDCHFVPRRIPHLENVRRDAMEIFPENLVRRAMLKMREKEEMEEGENFISLQDLCEKILESEEIRTLEGTISDGISEEEEEDEDDDNNGGRLPTIVEERQQQQPSAETVYELIAMDDSESTETMVDETADSAQSDSNGIDDDDNARKPAIVREPPPPSPEETVCNFNAMDDYEPTATVENETEQEVCRKKPPPPPPPPPEVPTIDTEKDEKDISQDFVCKICMVNEKTIVFLPCNHLMSCETCAPKLNGTCPMCRKPVDSVIRIYPC